jgi:hypothetical protein
LWHRWRSLERQIGRLQGTNHFPTRISTTGSHATAPQVTLFVTNVQNSSPYPTRQEPTHHTCQDQYQSSFRITIRNIDIKKQNTALHDSWHKNCSIRLKSDKQ